MTNTELLLQKIKGSGLKINYICSKLGITWHGFTPKVRGEVQFKQSEILGLQKLLGLTDSEVREIFFAPVVEKKSTEV